MTVKKEPRWMVLLGPKYLNFLPTYKRLKDMGATDKMIKESLREALYHYVFLKTSKRSEHFFCEYWFIEKRKSFEQIGNEHKLSWERVRQIVEKVKNQFIGKQIKFQEITKNNVKVLLYWNVIGKILQNNNSS